MDEETGPSEDTEVEELHESALQSIVRSILIRYKRKKPDGGEAPSTPPDSVEEV